MGALPAHSLSRCRRFGLSNLARFAGLLILLTAALHASPTAALAQSDTAALSGRITDQSDSVIVGASVELTEVHTGLSTSALTNDEGIYVFPNLRPGMYRMVVKKSGFRSILLSDLVLNVQDALSRNFTMQLGSMTDALTVRSSETDEQNLSPAVSTVVNQEFVENIPLNGRTFQSLLALTPGTVVTVPPCCFQGGSGLGQLSINGQRSNANYFMVDGLAVNFSIFALGQSVGGTLPGFTILGTSNGLVPLEAMREFRIQTSTFAPESGRTPGGQISIVTRSGGNQFHGTLFEYLRNDIFDARNYFDAPPLPKPPLRQNDFGGTFAGPIRKDRAFFFFTYEGLRLLLPKTAMGNFYTVAARANVAPSFQPLLAALPIPNGPVNSDGITAPLTMAYSDPTSLDSYGLRIDYAVNSWMTLFGRYSHSPSTQGIHIFSELLSSTADVDSVTVGATMSFGSNHLNDFRANWSRMNSTSVEAMTRFYGAVPPPVSTLLPSGETSSTFQFQLFPGGQDGPIENGSNIRESQRQIEFADVFSTSAGTHQIKFGADLRQLTPAIEGEESALVFSSYLQEQAGIAGSVGTGEQLGITARLYNVSLFAQDVWKASGKMTLTYGLRWEINTPLGSITPGRPLYNINGIFNSEPFGLVPANPLWQTRFNNFAPRFGAAYQATPQTVLRGGFGLFYDLGFGGGAPGSMSALPYQNSRFGSPPVPFDLSNPVFAPPPFTTVPNADTGNLFAVDPNLKLPLIYEWNAAVERGLGQNQSLSLTYVGSHGVNLLREDVIHNNPTGSPEISATRNADWSNYNALQVKFQRRMSRGLQVLASYTLGKSDDTNSSDVCGCTTSNSLQNINVGRDYGPSDFDVRNTLAAAVAYEFPSPTEGKLARAFLREWAVYAVVRANSAPPFEIVAPGNSPVFGFYETRPDIVPGVPFYLPDSQPGGRRLNAAAFATPAPGEQGDLPRNYFRGFPVNQTDFALSRRFRLSERVLLDFRAEYFNIFNHPMFAPPPSNFNNLISGRGFGLITSTLNDYLFQGPGTLSPLYLVGGPRSGQLTLKLQF